MMKTTELRKKIKKAVDGIPDDRLSSLADYVEFLKRPTIEERIVAAEKAVRAGRGVSWRKVRSDV